MRLQRRMGWLALLGVVAGQVAVADDSVTARLDALEKKVNSSAVVKVGDKGFSLASSDKAFELKFRGLVQADARFFFNDDEKASADSFLLRRVRPTLEGAFGGQADFRITPEFAGSSTTLLDAYAGYKFSSALALRAGKFKAPFGLERLQSGSDLRFIERAHPTSLAPNRDIGLQFHGELAGGALAHALGVFNGVADGGSSTTDSSDDKDVVGRIFLTPLKNSESEALKGLSFGIAGSYGQEEGNLSASNLAGYRSPGQVSIFSYRSSTTNAADNVVADGERVRYSPQFTYYLGPLGVLGEYVQSSHEVRRENSTTTLDHEAWQLAASYVLTGEANSFRGVTPDKPFDPSNGQWGAFELAARFSELALDPASFPTYANPDRSVECAQSQAVGLNWYLSRNLLAALTCEQTKFDGGAAGGGNRDDEKVLFARLQIGF